LAHRDDAEHAGSVLVMSTTLAKLVGDGPVCTGVLRALMWQFMVLPLWWPPTWLVEFGGLLFIRVPWLTKAQHCFTPPRVTWIRRQLGDD
jgi:hypothetical protein